MRVVVAVKRVADYNVRVRVRADGSGVDLTGVRMTINPFDEVAVEEAVRLKERGIAQEVVAVSVGERGCVETLRTALALGADRGLLVETETLLEPLTVAKALAAVIRKVSPALVLLGKQAVDDDAGQTGQMVAGLLRWPQVTCAQRVTVEESRGVAVVQREVDGGWEEVEAALPVVVTADLQLNTPRFASLPNIMKARQKPLEVIPLAQLGVEERRRVRVVRVSEPPKRPRGVRVADVAELVQRLRWEARVI